ncbi:hypothetical protein [Yersinia bercovieri]|uniref:hypothetical protein n=1 Tax=Yersinia bercovieri TaxID=634 RepID=UPI0011AB57DF|nr:hypothetical protein [Yersinia bercovieri]
MIKSRPPSPLKPQGCWLRSLTRITYWSKLIGIRSLAAYLQRQWLWGVSFALEAAGVLAALTYPNHLLE